MSFNELTTAQFHAAIKAGCLRLIEQKQKINEINVFPVPDGDTGDNMAATCASILEFSSAKDEVKATAESIADAAMIGARGNSGILLTHFFSGLAKYLHPQAILTFVDFSSALEAIGSKISSVLSKPEQGTLITLIEQLGILAKTKRSYNSMSRAMTELLPLLFEEVQNTANSLMKLAETRVVDAGALGFYYFIEGFSGFLQRNQTTSLRQDSDTMTWDWSHHEELVLQMPDYRFCTEAILKGAAFDEADIVDFLNKQGDCAAFSGNERLSKIHVHTNNPRALFTSLHQKYTIQYPKVDDMQRQYELQFARKHSIAIVTDSGADLPDDLLDAYQIHQFPLNIHIDDHHLLDKYSFEPDDFYKRLNHYKTHPKTSCINTNIIQEKIAKLSRYYEHILVLSISSKMSGMYDAFVEASQAHANVKVIDTKTSAAAHGLLIRYAAELIAANASWEQVVTAVEAARSHTVMFVLVNQFDSLIRSGRINKFSGRLAQLAHIKPIVSVDGDGHGIIAAKCLSKTAATNKILDLLQQKATALGSQVAEYCIVHADEPNEANALANLSMARFSKPPLFIDAASLAIGLHAGQGCVAIAARISS